MDVIGRAIIRNAHITDREELKGQTWRQFEVECRSKKLFIFGAGAAADYFFYKYQNLLEIEGVIDNAADKQGISIRRIIPSAWEYLADEIYIADLSILRGYLASEILVLITSTNYYEQIADQLLNMGVKNYYSLLIMEADRRNKLNDLCGEQYDENELRKQYVEKYAKQSINEHKIVFRAFGNYSDHEKYITEALLKKRKDMDLVWLVSNLKTPVPESVRLVWMGNWKQMIYELDTAKMWISDLPMFGFLQKRKGQVYIQTKHWASVTLKKFYLDAVTFQAEPQMLDLWRHDSQMIDYIITGSEFDTRSCRRGFAYQGEVLKIGSPRSDAMFNACENKKKVYQYYEIEETAHLLLYAPTYRFDKIKGKSHHELRNIELNYEKIKCALEIRFGGEWYILLRLHPSIASKSNEIERPCYVIDTSEYIDSQELASASEIMISDYSSIMFEPAFVKKPVFLFATDRKDYIDKEYDLLIDYDTLPFPIAETNEELASCILNFDQEKYEKELDAFMEKYGVHEDGHASERAAEFISNLIDERKYNA